MPPLDEYAVRPQQIETGLVTLKKRQRNLMLLGITSSVFFIASVIGLFVQQDFVYGFFGLTTQVEQLHLPSSIDAQLANFSQQPDYFVNLLSWFGWLFLKLFVAFIGSFLVIHFLRKIRFFYVRFQSFVLKFVGWLIAFIVLWSGLTYVQYDLKSEHYGEYQQLVRYDKNIQESEISHYLNESNVALPVKNYLLAQTALLHQPADRATAIPYVQALIKAEQHDPQFLSYGFKPEQLWSMQNQLFDKTITPMAQSVSKQVAQANVLSTVVYWVLWATIGLFFIMSALLFILSSHLKSRIQRIGQHLS
ncbi:hypothetical protein D7V64_12935 [Acinetobacter cumulans]|uniref:Uncharacterized protein n=1 Tax=Acinetobacter cumulans TaxID=2136182 RepID=A0A3A8FWQ4_9GAMM|nr:hypothetical protein [Acinetobacter cumulans]RKG50206.1 hypothetical protein D7V64_12935 [Acinetobacter cumulans]